MFMHQKLMEQCSQPIVITALFTTLRGNLTVSSDSHCVGKMTMFVLTHNVQAQMYLFRADDGTLARCAARSTAFRLGYIPLSV